MLHRNKLSLGNPDTMLADRPVQAAIIAGGHPNPTPAQQAIRAAATLFSNPPPSRGHKAYRRAASRDALRSSGFSARRLLMTCTSCVKMLSAKSIKQTPVMDNSCVVPCRLDAPVQYQTDKREPSCQTACKEGRHWLRECTPPVMLHLCRGPGSLLQHAASCVQQWYLGPGTTRGEAFQ